MIRTKGATTVLAVALLAAGVATAHAEGLRPAGAATTSQSDCHVARFGGAYAGLNAGGGLLASTLNNIDAAFGSIGSTVTKDNAFLAGGALGYAWQRCHMVIGLEADLAWTGFDSKTGYFGTPHLDMRHRMDWLGSLRVRSGLAVGDAMIFLTGGLAFAGIDTTYRVNWFPPADFASSGTRLGWVIGVGTEYAASERVHVTAEILHYDFAAEQSTTFPFGPSPVRYTDQHELWVSRIGVNFRLGGSSPTP